MSAGVVAFLVALSVGVWIFTKLNQKTGYGNSGNAIKGAVIAGLIIFLIIFTIAKTLIKTN